MEPIEELTSKIAEKTVTRRGFIATLGKIAAGAAAVVAGISLTGRGKVHAAGLTCCSGTACHGSSCPSGSSVGYNNWVCCDGSGCNTGERCSDCYSNSSGAYVCTFQTITRVQGCPC